jgi:hypothetical protein
MAEIINIKCAQCGKINCRGRDRERLKEGKREKEIGREGGKTCLGKDLGPNNVRRIQVL